MGWHMKFYVLLPLLAFAACGKAPSPEKSQSAAEEKPVEERVAVQATPTPAPSPTPLDLSGQVTILCYHRFELAPKDGLAMTPAQFESEMQALKDAGISVISMEDFLAWQRGEKSIPPKAALITIDDGYKSVYENGWPILKKFGYPFTMFVYTDYVKGGPKSGGGSMSWDQLAEMRDSGVEIGSHSVSHSALNQKKGKTEEEYRKWLWQELAESKHIIEENLGIKVRAHAYPYGLNNDTVRELAKAAGYEAAFTVKGERFTRGGDPFQYGRYATDSKNLGIFKTATNFGGAGGAVAASSDYMKQALPGAPAAASAAAPTYPVNPAPGEVAPEALPLVSVDLSSAGAVDPASVKMVVSGIGEVPAVYDASTGMVSFRLRQRLYADDVRVSVVAKAGGKPVGAHWAFRSNLQ